jgi:hypothetical protein
MFVGILLILLGTLALLDQMDIISGPIWGYFWPLAIVALGISMIFKREGRRTP